MEKRKVEIFTAGCPVCEPVVQEIKTLACSSCEITVYDLSDSNAGSEHMQKVKEYNITSLPAVAVNGKLLTCCTGKGVQREELINAGIGNQL